jgi:hypothetical protein
MQTYMIELKRNEAMKRAIYRAKNARPKVKPVDVAARVYTVTGSKGDTYTVRFAVSGSKKFASCDCKGGQAGMVCYHIASAAAVNIGLQGMRRAAEQSAAVKLVKAATARRASMLDEARKATLLRRTVRGEMCNGIDV